MIRHVIPQPGPERQHIGNQINAAMIFARSHFVNVRRTHFFLPGNNWAISYTNLNSISVKRTINRASSVDMI